MAVRYKFMGYGDDLIHVQRIEFSYTGEGTLEIEEYNPKNSCGKYEIATFLVEGDWGDCKVHAIYDGTWSFAISLFEEDDELPTGISNNGIYKEHGYSTCLSFDAADNTRVMLEE